MSTEPVQCKYFFRTNGCSRGDACIYSHEKMDTDSFRQPTQIICIHHQRGFCRSGDLCKFFHAPAPEDSAAASRSWRSPRSVKPVSEFIPSAFSKPISSITPGAQKPLPFGSCKFFQQGQCTKGGSCTFSHSQPAAAAAFADPFRKTTHPVFISSAPNADAVYAAPTYKQPCRFYAIGTCGKGDLCHYSHQSSDKPQTSLEYQTSHASMGDEIAAPKQEVDRDTVSPSVIALLSSNLQGFYGVGPKSCAG